MISWNIILKFQLLLQFWFSNLVAYWKHLGIFKNGNASGLSLVSNLIWDITWELVILNAVLYGDDT